MISSITPVVYGSRRRLRWLVAVGLYSSSAALGSVLTGVAVSGLGFWVQHFWASLVGLRWFWFAVVAFLYSLHEAGLLQLPYPQREWQVPSGWRVQYHPWIVALLYGFFLGLGFLTRISVPTFHLFLFWAFLVGSPGQAAPMAALFGLSQGLPLLITGWKIHSWEDAYRIGSKSWSLRALVHRLNFAVLAIASIYAFAGVYAPMAWAHFLPEDVGMRLYVADTHDSTHGSIEVYDPSTGRRLKTLPTNYSPEIAVSPNGKLLFVIESDVQASRTTHHLLVYNTGNFKLLKSIPLSHRSLYNVRPSSAELVVSEDGRYVYLLRTETLGNDKANYSVAVYDVEKGEFLPEEVKLPEGVLVFGKLHGRADLFAAVQGREVEGLAWGDPAKNNMTARLHTFEHPVRRGHEFTMSAVAVDPNGMLLYEVTRNGLLRIAEVSKDAIGPETKLDIPNGSAVPIQHLFVTASNLILGVSSKEGAARGQAESIYVFDRSSLKRIFSFKLSPPSEQIEISPDGSKLYAASLADGSIATYDIKGGKSVARINKAATNLARFSLASAP